VTGIDLSAEGIRQAKQAAELRASFHVMNAEALEFADGDFDLVFGMGILHHLDLDTVGREVARVLRPNGRAVFFEPLGHNPLINLYRKLTPDMRTDDEHPLLTKHLRSLAEYFQTVHASPFGLCVLGALPFRRTPIFGMLLRSLEWLDEILLRLPWVKWQAWVVVLTLERPRFAR